MRRRDYDARRGTAGIASRSARSLDDVQRTFVVLKPDRKAIR
jgi:hypothetical protein